MGLAKKRNSQQRLIKKVREGHKMLCHKDQERSSFQEESCDQPCPIRQCPMMVNKTRAEKNLLNLAFGAS